MPRCKNVETQTAGHMYAEACASAERVKRLWYQRAPGPPTCQRLVTVLSLRAFGYMLFWQCTRAASPVQTAGQA